MQWRGREGECKRPSSHSQPVIPWSQVSLSSSPAKQVSGLMVPKAGLGWGSACTHFVQQSRCPWTVSSDWSASCNTVVKYFQSHPHRQSLPCEKSLAGLWKTARLACQKQKSHRHSSKASTSLIMNITPDDSRSSCHEAYNTDCLSWLYAPILHFPPSSNFPPSTVK